MASVAIQLIKDEFAGPDYASRRRAADKLPLLCKVLGPERTATELLPLVTELIQGSREQDEILFLLVKGLTSLYDLLGKYIVALLGPLEVLTSVEETTVRDRAIAGIVQVSSRLSSAQVQSELLPLMKRLASAEWFTPRRSSCGLLVSVYTQIDVSARAEVYETFTLLIGDETPMVRRAAAAAISGMAQAPGGTSAAPQLAAVWQSLTEDPHVTVRVAATNTTAGLAVALGKAAAETTILPQFVTLASSRGWRVRAAVAGQLGAMTRALPVSAYDKLVQITTSLLRDGEDEVCEPAVRQLVPMCEALGRGSDKQFVEAIYQALFYLSPVATENGGRRGETSARVRRAVARATIGLAKLDAQGIGSRFVPLWESFLKDTTSKDASDVRRVCVDGITQIAESVGPQFALGEQASWGKLLRTLFESSKSKAVDEFNAAKGANNPQQTGAAQGDAMPGEPVETPKWRVRRSILMSVGVLYSHDKTYALQVWNSCLSDEASEVRVAAGDALVLLCNDHSAVGGTAGVMKEFLPLLKSFWDKAKDMTKGSYQQRITVVRTAARVSVFEPVWHVVKPMYVEALKDPVSNVVLAALLAAEAAPVVRNSLKAELSALMNSSYPDISAAAQRLTR